MSHGRNESGYTGTRRREDRGRVVLDSVLPAAEGVAAALAARVACTGGVGWVVEKGQVRRRRQALGLDAVGSAAVEEEEEAADGQSDGQSEVVVVQKPY